MTDAAAVAVLGAGPLARRLRNRIMHSPLPIEIVDEASPGDVTVHEASAPPGSYLGVATVDRPGEVFLDDDAALDYVVALVEHFATSGATSVTVRRSLENEWRSVCSGRLRHKRLRRFRPDDYTWIGVPAIDDDVFDGEAVLRTDDDEIVARVRIAGALDPLDGRYHWAGTAFGDEVRRWKDDRTTTVSVSVGGGGAVDARLAEVTPSGAVRVVGVGEPPYPLEELVALVEER